MKNFDQYTITRSRKKRQIIVISIFLPIIIMFLFYILNEELFYIRNMGFILAVLALIPIFSLLMLYLRYGFTNTKNSMENYNSAKIDMLSNKLSETKHNIEKILEENNKIKKENISILNQLPEIDITDLQNKISEDILKEAPSHILELLTEKVEMNSVKQNQEEIIRKTYSSIIKRLEEEISSLNRRSNLNLSIGIIITIVGIGLLTFFVFEGIGEEFPSTVSFLVSFGPKVSLVLFIELFAFFFLKLYKTSLLEIKHYQNAITNIENQSIILTLAKDTSSEELTTDILYNLSFNIDYDLLKYNDKEQTKVLSDQNIIELLKKILIADKKE